MFRRASTAAQQWLERWRIRRACAGYRLPGGYRRVFHYHVRKTAGTSLNAAFWALGGLELAGFGEPCCARRGEHVFVRHDPALIERGQYLFANGHHSAHTLNLPDATFTVTILRDPIQRLLSYYRYLRFVRDDPAASAREPYGELMREEIESLGADFCDFLGRVPKPHLLAQLHMFSRTYDVAEATERVLSCSAVLFTETYAQDLARLADRLGLVLPVLYKRRFGEPFKPGVRALKHARGLLADELDFVAAVSRGLGREGRRG